LFEEADDAKINQVSKLLVLGFQVNCGFDNLDKD